MSSPHGSRNLALANGLNACSVIALLLFGCRRAADTDVIYFLKTLSCYIFFANVLTAWTFKGYTNSFKRNYMVSQVLSRGFSLLVSVLGFHLILILFGASVVESSNETFYFALLLALTSVFPCLLMVGPTVESWISKGFQDGSEKYVLMTSVSSIVGAWLGAFVIPLDWDRWWQLPAVTILSLFVVPLLCSEEHILWWVQLSGMASLRLSVLFLVTLLALSTVFSRPFFLTRPGLGAPLSRDLEEVWPVSCVWGNQIGYCIGLLITCKCMLLNANDRKAQKGV